MSLEYSMKTLGSWTYFIPVYSSLFINHWYFGSYGKLNNVKIKYKTHSD